MDAPIYDPKNETVNQYMARIKEYKLELKCQKHDLVLKFLNELFDLDKKYKSLASIKGLPLEEKDNLGDMVDEYNDQFKEYLNCDFNNDYYLEFVDVLTRILKPIGYKLKVFRKKDNDGNKSKMQYFSIILAYV